MTLTTRIAVTSPGVDARAVFDLARELVGATGEHRFYITPDPASKNDWHRTAAPGFHMAPGQGLRALMYVRHFEGELSPEHDDAYTPRHYVLASFDTPYGYRGPNGAACGDLHAWIVREMGAWLTDLGATWQWYDESGHGWTSGLDDYGTLGDPGVGDPASTGLSRRSDPRLAAIGRVIEIFEAE